MTRSTIGLDKPPDGANTTLSPGPITPLYLEFLDEHKRKIAEIVMQYVVCFSIGFVGIVTNTLVILVYTRQRFKESVAVSMTTIALWDLVKSIAGVMERFSGVLSVWYPAAAFSWATISVILKYLICFSSYVTSVMAAYVAVERCLCVSIPLKVKWLLTPKVTLIACLVMSFTVFGSFAVLFAIYDFVWEWSAAFNATVAVYKKNAFYLSNEAPLFQFYNYSAIVWPTTSFIVIVIATIIIVHKLRQGSKFRAGQAGGYSSLSAPGNLAQQEQPGQHKTQANLQQQQQQQQHQLSSRDRQVVKMLLVIIIIYIACPSPRISLYIYKIIDHDFYFLRKYHHLFTFVIHWIWLSDFVNGTVNFFVFYAMSSSFRATFLAMISSSSNTKTYPSVK